MLQLRVALQQLKAHPGYLSHEKCPYSPTTVELLQELATRSAGPVEAVVVTFENEGEKLDYVEAEIVKVLTDLTALVNSLSTADHSEKLQVAKARAGLIEKLVNNREKIWSMREMSEFQGRIMRFLESQCSKDQIADLKAMLAGLKSVEAAS